MQTHIKTMDFEPPSNYTELISCTCNQCFNYKRYLQQQEDTDVLLLKLLEDHLILVRTLLEITSKDGIAGEEFKRWTTVDHA